MTLRPPFPLLALLFTAPSDTKALCICAQSIIYVRRSAREYLNGSPHPPFGAPRICRHSTSFHRASPTYPRRRFETHLPRQLAAFRLRVLLVEETSVDAPSKVVRALPLVPAFFNLLRVSKTRAPESSPAAAGPTPYPRHLGSLGPAAESLTNPQSTQVSKQLRHIQASDNAEGHHSKYGCPVFARGERAPPRGRHLRRLGPKEANQYRMHPLPEQVRMPFPRMP